MKQDLKIVTILFLLVISAYTLSHRGEGAHFNYFILLADSFLNGRLDILNPPPWLNEVVFWKGFYYPVFPPMPTFLLIPFVAIFGTNFYQPILSWILGAVNVSLSYIIFLKLFNRRVALWMSILYGFGTIQWYHAEVGSAWYLAHIVALFFLWIILLETVTRQRLFLIGLFLGAAYLSRIPTILAIIFVFFYLREKFLRNGNGKIKIYFKSFLLIGLGLLPPILFNAWYNFVRYDVPFDIGYSLLPIFDEPWYKYGLVNIRYIPIHLKEMFTSMPVLIDYPPYVIPNLFAMAIWLITPAYFLIFFAKFRKKLILLSAVTAVIVALPSLMHGGNGFTQFGYRHTLDYLPFLLILTASGFETKPFLWAKVLIFLSILINLWGVVIISFLNLWRI